MSEASKRDQETSMRAIQDNRIMVDGRPAYAWWNEIQMLRQRDQEVQEGERRLAEKMAVLRIAEWVTAVEMPTGDTLIRFRWSDAVLSPAHEFLEHPEKFCEIVKREVSHVQCEIETPRKMLWKGRSYMTANDLLDAMVRDFSSLAWRGPKSEIRRRISEYANSVAPAETTKPDVTNAHLPVQSDSKLQQSQENARNGAWRKMCIVEIAVENQSVRDYIGLYRTLGRTHAAGRSRG